MSLPQKKDERSALESIEHELYDPKVKVNETEIHRTRQQRALDLPNSWGDDAPLIVRGEEEKGLSFGVKLLLVSILLLIVALSFSLWRVMSLRNVVSATNIEMNAIISPFVEGGESTPLTLTLLNKNTSTLLDANVTLLYKQGNGSQDEQEKIQEKRELGSISPNESKAQTFNVSLYGSESEARDLVLKLEYKVLGSNALFTKIVNARVVLRASSVSVTIAGPSKITVGQSGTYVFTVKNNSATTSLQSVLQVIMPASFVQDSITPKPVNRGTSWGIAPLAPLGTATVTVIGSFAGKQGDISTFSAKVGSVGDNPTTIGIVYASQSTDVMLSTSPIVLVMGLSSLLGGGESIRYGDTATLNLEYNNASTEVLEDVSIKLTLSGDAALYGNINPTSGYYDSIQKTITWNKASLPDLAVLSPNSRGTLQVIIPIVQRGTNSPTLKAALTSVASTKSSDEVTAAISKVWGVQGSVTLEAHSQYKDSPFQNTGPIPPEPNQATTYTVRLKLAVQNTLSSARVSFTLPAYVSWRGEVTSGGAVTYDAKTRTVTWNVGRAEQNTYPVVDIGLTVTPSQSHVNQAPVITSGIILDADEEVSRTRLRSTLSPLTTAVYNESWPVNPSLVVKK